MRVFAVISVIDGVDIAGNLLDRLPKGDRKVVFLRKGLEGGKIPGKLADLAKNGELELRFYPDELRCHGSKLKNFVYRSFFDEKIGGFLHIIEDSVEIFSPPGTFLAKIEEMMDAFQLKSWFNTSCDICNFVYSRYNPRFYVAIDEPEARKRYDTTVAWCSNANTAWICLAMERATFGEVRFDEDFAFPMYYIIEFLARRRNVRKPGELEYMNLYPSIPEELGVFRFTDAKGPKEFTNDEIQAEGRLFQEKKVDNHPDGSLEELMEAMHAKIMAWKPTI